MKWLVRLAAFHQVAVLSGPLPSAPASLPSGGLRNALVVGVLPLAMAALARAAGGGQRPSPLPTDLVLPFCGLWIYAGLAGFWGGYPVAALKLLVYLAAYACVLFAFLTLGRTSRRALLGLTVWFLVWALALGVVQTFVLGNPFGSLAYRFTAFGAPQPFALALAVLAGLVLCHLRERNIAPALALAALSCCIVALLLCGGRQAFVAATGLCLLASLPLVGATKPSRAWLPPAALVSALLLATSLQMAGPKDVAAMLEAHPASQLLFLSDADLQASGDAGTARARSEIFKALWKRFRGGTFVETLFGHGTSSAAVVIAEGDVAYRDYDATSLDPNRTAHNEFLRALYEWGLTGLVLLCAVVLAPLRAAFRSLRTRPAAGELLLFATAVIALVGFTLLGNSLAAMSGPLGPALCLLCAEICLRARGATA